jgi:hypothetical protein
MEVDLVFSRFLDKDPAVHSKLQAINRGAIDCREHNSSLKKFKA